MTDPHVQSIAARLSLRRPQHDSLGILAQVAELIPLAKASDPLKDFNHAYEGTKSVTEEMRLEYQRLLDADETLAVRIGALPGGTFSGRERGRTRAGSGLRFSSSTDGMGSNLRSPVSSRSIRGAKLLKNQ